MNIKTKALDLFVKLKRKMNINKILIDTTSSHTYVPPLVSSRFVLLEGVGNVFWTIDDGSNHEGFKILHRGSDQSEMIKKWEHYYRGHL